MSILRHLYLSTAMRNAEDGTGSAAPDPAAILPETAPAASEPAAPDPATSENPPAPVPKAPAMVPLRILQERVGEETTKRQQFEQRATQAEQRAADLQAILDRMQTERPDPANPTPAPRAPAAQPTAPRSAAGPEFDATVRAQAQHDRFVADTVDVRSAGEAKFPDFVDTLHVLTAIGATTDDFLSDLLAVDKSGAHEILDKLAKDAEKAASLVRMEPRRRIAELTRMSDALKPAAAAADPAAVAAAAKPAPAAQSRAPAPKPVIVPQAAAAEVDPTTAEGNDKMDDAQFEKWYKGKYYKTA